MVWERVENIKAHISFYAHFFCIFLLKKKERNLPVQETKPNPNVLRTDTILNKARYSRVSYG